MLITGAFYESQDGGGVLHYLKAVPDPQLMTENDQMRVPVAMPNLVAKAGLSAATTLTSARLESPSLARMFYPEIEPLINAVVFADPPQVHVSRENVMPLLGDESLRFAINSDNTGAAVEYGLVWFSDGAISEAKGSIFPVRATAAIALAAGQWVNGQLTFDQTLPVGSYDVVGMRARGTNLVCARLQFIGLAHRPGVPAVNAIGDLDAKYFRDGKMGNFGRFHSTTPPSIDCLGVTDTAQEIILDLIKVG